MQTEEILESISSTNIPFVKLTDDMLFKDIFGSRKGRIFLEDLLECYYKLKPGTMHKKLMVTTEYHHEREKYKEKDTRSDIVVIFNNKFINVEMYRNFNKKALRKSERYVMKISTSQLDVGDDYEKIKKVTQINFIEKDELNISEEFISTIDYGISKDISMDFVIFDNLPKDEYNGSRFHKYVKFMNANSYEERRSIAKGDEMLMKLEDFIEKYCDDDENLMDYDKVNWDKEIYEESGRIQSQNAIAKEMLKNSEPIDKIKKYTKLSLTEINKIKKEIEELEK